ncbi:hypothetical protein [Sphingobacterium athyrii]|uniref:Uncharacterized protein n=1 Tax=Sphingobacterium athyrii TaxID=2152717 RepID=A0A363NKU8_9SPHI|nr:hypothetical protein [Sphingobacterium athyrii]PUV21439.1 hypothetical protein DCO56_26905 [Sphingobacterium athyrii]
MAIISKNMEIQERIIGTFEELQSAIHGLESQLVEFELLFNQACDRHIASDFQKECLLDRISSRHVTILSRHESLQLIQETVSAYRDYDGLFLDHKQLLQSLELLMLNHAEREEYEIAAIIKKWYEKFVRAVDFIADLAY